MLSKELNLQAALSDAQLLEVEEIASEIWHQHYEPIIGSEQVEYMLSKFQSFSAMQQQIADGFEYYIALEGDAVAGYIGIQPREGKLFISKFYLLQDFRGRGHARSLLNFITQRAVDLKLNELSLTVNKYNDNTIAAYKKMGFSIKREVVFDIGEGYVMDDYEMKKKVQA
jgi:ribosomal protein S18 acetylase RimI-like enzyme